VKYEKTKTKGRFLTSLPNTGGMWMLDKEWQRKANPIADQEEKKRDNFDRLILEKRKHGRLLKNMAME